MDAIKGNLTKQNKSDGDATDIIKSIREKKNRSKSNFRAKHEHDIHIKDDDLLFDIPNNWEWTVLGELSTLITDGTHKTPNYVDNGIPFLSVQNISGGSFDLSKMKYITKTEHISINNRCNPQRGDILLCRIGTLGKPIIVDLDFPFSIFVSLALIKLANCEIAKYVELVLSSPLMDSWMTKYKVGGGTHTNKLNLRDLYYIPIPLPPLAEQKRIVEKLDEILPLIDSLEKDEFKLNDLMQQFPENMKSSILQAAIQGKITEQNSDKENTLLDYNNDHIFHQPNSIDAYPFAIPENWAWVKMIDIIKLGNGIKVSNVDHKYLDVKYLRKKSEPTYVKTGRFIQAGSRIILVDGENSGEIFVTNEDGYMGSTFRTLELKYDSIWDYIRIFLEFHKTTFKNNKTGSAIPHLNKQLFNNLLVSVPPIAEQKRILERLEQLLPIVDNINVG